MKSNIVRIRDLLRSQNQRLVLVESCTSGWIAAQFGAIPGISEFFCGSLVIYRNDSKHQWLGIDSALLNDPHVGPVSDLVTCQLAHAAITKTPESTIAAAITGHLGPGSPHELDGIVFVAIARRALPTSDSKPSNSEIVESRKLKLQSIEPVGSSDILARTTRQMEAGELLIQFLFDYLLRSKPN